MLLQESSNNNAQDKTLLTSVLFIPKLLLCFATHYYTIHDATQTKEYKQCNDYDNK